jgi:hypothetical protein
MSGPARSRTPSAVRDPGDANQASTARSTKDRPLVRSIEMSLLYEQLSRAHSEQLLREAEQARRVRRLLAARRWQRRAERAALRARLALVSVW